MTPSKISLLASTLAAALLYAGAAQAGPPDKGEPDAWPQAIQPVEPAPPESLAPDDRAKPDGDAPDSGPSVEAPRRTTPPAVVVPTAHAGALLHMFQTFCRGTYAGKTAVLAAAEREGFRPAPVSEMKYLAGFSFEDLELRANTVDGVRMLVAAGRGRQAAMEGRPGLDVCIVGVTPTESGAAGSFGHWAGVEPVSPPGAAGAMFMFVEGPDGRRSVGAGVGDMRRHVRDGDMQLLLVGDQDGSTLAIYGVMRPQI